METLRQARAEAETLGSRRILWQILAALSEAERESGNEGEARKVNEQAKSVVAYIADHTPDELRPSFLNLPQVRSILAASV